MQNNLPITQQEYDFPDADALVSTTDTRGFITHCNHAFVATSGYAYEELIGQPHNLIRHPDMPEAAFKDMWRTIGRGSPWTGFVKNRRKNGDHYWVLANVTPILENGKPCGYMSVRIKPSRAQVHAAEALYARLARQAKAGGHALSLEAGQVRQRGLAGWSARLHQASLTARMGVALALVGGASLLPDLMQWSGPTAALARLGILALGLGAAFAWFHLRQGEALKEAVRFAGELSGCNLLGEPRLDFPEPMGTLMRRLNQIQINLRAVVGDVRKEIAGFTASAREIAQGSLDLAGRTESQASSLEQTAASMEELSGTVRQTADTAAQMASRSDSSREVASRGEQAVRDAREAMDAIEQSSSKIGSITSVIQGIAFQTNILALNAAVEAARAGESGRGFAVVAAEVRALAQRSASAAKEIQQLTAEAAQRIAQGTERIHGAGTTLAEVMNSVRDVSAMVHQITGATQEQSLGIAQVNQAVAQLDTVTQQNAALVEESAASAGALGQSAETLQRAVGVFQMREGTPIRAASGPQVTGMRPAIPAHPRARAHAGAGAATPQVVAHRKTQPLRIGRAR
ncbi:chemotaxis protein [Rhodoferax koreense]|uniref:Chemotaxis protein n=1 Tax=Rhodoferax koreensis TaxID=1842727 RepID=A0A1P8JU47_9BURK|nr:PAS domain-containing methyl-accepting chemotaxis protein [Rhodoferax koreense]APW37248.1 chemotaxis protein [Rhodoferax koreense]